MSSDVNGKSRRAAFPAMSYKSCFMPRKQQDLLILYNPVQKTGLQKKTVQKSPHFKTSFGKISTNPIYKISASFNSYLTNQGFGFGTDQIELASNRHQGHSFTRQCINFFSEKVYSQAVSFSTESPIVVVDVGAQFIRSSSIFKNMRTPKF